jgi:hypothetical protein
MRIQAQEASGWVMKVIAGREAAVGHKAMPTQSLQQGCIMSNYFTKVRWQLSQVERAPLEWQRSRRRGHSLDWLLLGGVIIKKLASFRHKTQKFFFWRVRPLEFSC